MHVDSSSVMPIGRVGNGRRIRGSGDSEVASDRECHFEGTPGIGLADGDVYHFAPGAVFERFGDLRGRDGQIEDAVRVAILRNRKYGGLAVRGPPEDHRELAFEREEFLEDARDAFPFAERALEVRARIDARLSLAVIAEAR